MPEVSDLEERHNALDALFTEATGEKPPAGDSGASGGAGTATAATAAVEGKSGAESPAAGGSGGPGAIDIKPKPAASASAAPAPAAEPAKGSVASTTPATTAGAAGASSAGPAGAGAAGAVAAGAPKDSLDSVELPPYSKPKSVEAFSKVKELARQTITQRDAEITRLQAEVAQREEKLKGVLPPEAAKELEDLRTFRRSVDIENDAGFKQQFEGKIQNNNLAILTKLTEAGLSKAQLDQITKLGGPEAVDWDEILPRLPAPARRFIESKLVANEDLRGERKTAIEQARKDPGVFEKQRVEHQAKTIYETANSFLQGLPWTAERAIPANVKPEEKTKLEAENAFAKETQGRLTEALKDYSPARFAELAVGTAMAYKFKRDYETAQAETKSIQTNLDAVIKERDALKAELDKIKQAGQTHRRTSATPPATPVPRQFEAGITALDRLRDEVAAS